MLNTSKDSINNSLNTIPSNLKVSIHNGQLSSNLFRPFLLWIKYPREKFLFLVIDEKANPVKIKEYESSVLLTKDSFTVINQKQLYTFAYSQFTDNLNLNKSDILKLYSQIMNKIKLISIIVFPLLFILIPFALFITSIINIVLSSLVVYLFYRSFNKHYNFTKILQVGFYSSSLPLFILIILFSLSLWKFIPIYLPLILIFIFQITGVYEAHYSINQHISHLPITHHKKK